MQLLIFISLIAVAVSASRGPITLGSRAGQDPLTIEKAPHPPLPRPSIFSMGPVIMHNDQWYTVGRTAAEEGPVHIWNNLEAKRRTQQAVQEAINREQSVFADRKNG